MKLLKSTLCSYAALASSSAFAHGGHGEAGFFHLHAGTLELFLLGLFSVFGVALILRAYRPNRRANNKGD